MESSFFSKICIVIIILHIHSCTFFDRSTEKISTSNYSIFMNSSGRVQFELDSITAPIINHVQIFSDSKDTMFTFLNEETGVIYFNDIQTGKKNKLLRASELSNLKKSLQGYYIKNLDSIYLFNLSSKIYLSNINGNIKKTFDINKYKITQSNPKFFNSMHISATTPAFMHNNNLYINSVIVGDLSGKENKLTQFYINLTNDTIGYGKTLFPKSYYNKHYGGLHYYIQNVLYVPVSEQIIHSFPASDSVQIFSFKTNKIIYVNASSSLFDEIPEISDEMKEKDEVGKYFLQSPSYRGIYYDEKNKYYYRIALLPAPSGTNEQGLNSKPVKRVSIIILDENLKKIGETLLPENLYWAHSVFVYNGGLYIQRRTQTDDYIDYEYFKPSFKNTL